MNQWIETLINSRNRMIFEDLAEYKPDRRHSFSVVVHTTNKEEINKSIQKGYSPTEAKLYIFHNINEELHDTIEFSKINNHIILEYTMENRARENFISRENPDEWVMFSNKMPWKWMHAQFKILAVKHV